MLKKIFIVVMALLVFAMPFHQDVQAVAVASKVVNASAKKVAKEIAVDTAVQMSMNMVLDYKYVPKDSRVPKDGFSFVCMPKDKTSSGDCTKPMEVKTNLSSAEKTQIASKVESNLDRKVAGGIGATRFGKFLDWFVPIFSIGMGVAVVDYAMNGDVSDLFDELGYEALVELGLITGDSTEGGTPYTPKDMLDLVITSATTSKVIVGAKVKPKYANMKGVIRFPGTGSTSEWDSWYAKTGNPLDAIEVSVGSDIKQASLGKTSQSWKIVTFPSTEIKQTVSPQLLASLTDLWSHMEYVPNKYNPDAPMEVAPLPKFDQLALPRTNKANEPIKIPAPGSLPFTKTDTGEELLPYPKPDGTTGFKTRTGVEVPPDNVTPGSPLKITNPDGSTTIKKAPSVATPNPSPSEDGKIPPKDDEITEEEMEGLSCARIKKPDFKPLTTAFTTSFPFSIPWDLWRVIEAVFGNMGSEKPVVNLSFIADGVKLEIPDYFDSWTKFAKSITLIAFDIGLIYLFYRFMKGGAD